MSPVSREHLGDEIDLFHETRGSPINRPPNWCLGVRRNAGTATLADGSKQAIRIVLTEMATVAHGFDLASVDWLVKLTGLVLPMLAVRTYFVPGAASGCSSRARPIQHRGRIPRPTCRAVSTARTRPLCRPRSEMRASGCALPRRHLG